jgi:2-polyprenyl-3-methyl-5-hydroxy-6-metoxy-1,4-benzoquinol methylase
MTLVMTLLVRDEADIVEAHLDFHLAMGVDFVIATDNRSVDGTTDVLRQYEKDGVLRYILEEDDDYSQSRWVTHMARLAAAEHGADWVINSDADEFWLPRRGGDLARALDSVPPTDDLVVVPRFNALAVTWDLDEPFHRRMTVRHATSEQPEEGWVLPPKVAHRAHELVLVGQGNHEASWPGVGGTMDPGPLEILHFPTRSPDQLENKIVLGGAAYERNTELPPEIGNRWRQLYEDHKAGRFPNLVAKLFHDDPDEVQAGVADGRYVEDLRVTQLLDRIAPEKQVRRIGPEVDYADQAEGRILRVLRTTGDRSAGSDALASQIVDWPTRYHLSALRGNLVQPLSFGPGMRVLEVGAGSGAVTRAVAETGAQITALEGNIDRARAIAVRCSGLPNVEVVCGSIVDFEGDAEGFDVVLCVGVLEYSGAGLPSTEAEAAAARNLAAMKGHLKADGLLALAIENRLGLKYLLGYGEDHHDEPYVGVEGYGGRSVRTWGKDQLAEMLREHGLPQQRWLFPFPDYKLPRVVMADTAYEQPDAVRLVDALVRDPCSPEPLPPFRLADERKAHAAFVAAGIGPDVANSFLVVAGPEGGDVTRLVDADALAWHHGGPRLKAWRRVTTVRDTPDGRVAERTSRGPERPERNGWLEHVPATDAPYTLGPTGEQLVLEAAGDHDEERVAEVLRRWKAGIVEQATPVADGAADGLNPFIDQHTTSVVPDALLDANLRNFVQGPDGTFTFVDDELRAAGGADVDVVLLRALYELSRDLVVAGADHPWSRRLTVVQMTELLGELADVEVDEELLARWRTAEVQLQQAVVGHDEKVLAPLLEQQGTLARTNPKLGPRLPMTTLRSDLRKTDRARHDALVEVARLEGELAATEAERDELRTHLDRWEQRFRFVRGSWAVGLVRKVRGSGSSEG